MAEGSWWASREVDCYCSSTGQYLTDMCLTGLTGLMGPMGSLNLLYTWNIPEKVKA